MVFKFSVNKKHNQSLFDDNSVTESHTTMVKKAPPLKNVCNERFVNEALSGYRLSPGLFLLILQNKLI